MPRIARALFVVLWLLLSLSPAQAQVSLDLHLGTYAGNQSGDPARLALLIIQAADHAKPPLHLFAGHIANELAVQKMKAIGEEMEIWKGSSEATDFPV